MQSNHPADGLGAGQVRLQDASRSPAHWPLQSRAFHSKRPKAPGHGHCRSLQPEASRVSNLDAAQCSAFSPAMCPPRHAKKKYTDQSRDKDRRGYVHSYGLEHGRQCTLEYLAAAAALVPLPYAARSGAAQPTQALEAGGLSREARPGQEGRKPELAKTHLCS